MHSKPAVQELIQCLPTMKPCPPGTVYLAHCPLHDAGIHCMVVDFDRDSVVCMSCGFAGTPALLLDEIQRREGSAPLSFAKKKTTPPNISLPWDNYGHLITAEVCRSIHNHLFSSKVKELNSAVEQLAQLISRMKQWIDPEK